ncbi:MAG: metallophosphoesterase [Oligoflexales bacterium]
MRTLGFFIGLLAIGCRSSSPVSESFDEVSVSSMKVMAIGDIQQMDYMTLNSSAEPFTKEEWLAEGKHKLKTKILDDLKPYELIPSIENLSHILQVGDIVDLNNALRLDIDGEELSPPYDEWKTVFERFPSNMQMYGTIGNHETYKTMKYIDLIKVGDNELKVDGNKMVREFNSPQQRMDILKTKYPPVAGDRVFFGEAGSGSYFVNFANYCLFSLDGNDLLKGRGLTLENVAEYAQSKIKTLDEWKPFFEAHLRKNCSTENNDVWTPKKPTIITIHFPVFSALARGEDIFHDGSDYLSDVASHFVELANHYNFALVLSGHEHFYFRYLNDKGRTDAGYQDLKPKSAYVTIGNFGVTMGADGHSQAKKIRGASPRIDLTKNGQDFVLHEGPHYAVLDIANNKIDYTAFRFSESTKEWEAQPFDKFSIGLGANGEWSVE